MKKLTEIIKNHALRILGVTVIIFSISTNPLLLQASVVDDLKQKIDERAAIIRGIESEIAAYEKQILTTGKESKTLEQTISSLDVLNKKISAQIREAVANIEETNLRIQKLTLEANSKQQNIEENSAIIAKILRDISDLQSDSFIESFLRDGSIGNALERHESLIELQSNVRNKVELTKILKLDLEAKRSQSEIQKSKLLELNSTLNDRRILALENKKDKSALLSVTKNKEANFKKIVAEKQALKIAFEQELADLESKLHFEIDASKIPAAGSGVLKWPLSSVKITQKFGNTEFALAHSAVYNGQGHNGVDFAATQGTPIKAASSGIITGTGNTDTVCPGASYGKWILVQHANGLSTLYGHLSLIKVKAGQDVRVGDTIGYSGNTGYSTGPHLHFTVYATQGVRIMDRASKACGGTYTMPVADYKAYLDPLKYL